jgi:iron complex outermembrane receptor protein
MHKGAIGSAIALALAAPPIAHAQRAAENPVASAEDAFGTNVGLESVGIYTEADTRGFSPLKAGNVRVDGVYIDTVQTLPGRLRESTAIRVGFSAAEYPFHAPTGIVDHRLRPFPIEVGFSVAATRFAYGGYILESDLRLPIVADHLSLTGGVTRAVTRQGDGGGNHTRGMTIRPIVRFGGVEIAPFIHRGTYQDIYFHPLVVVASGALPPQPPGRRFVAQRWADGRQKNASSGVVVKAAITDSLSLRGGLFFVEGDRVRNFTEIFSIVGGPPIESGRANARYRLIADPEQDLQSTSGEVQVAWRMTHGRWQHRLIAGYRGRDRLTESGGSDRRDFGVIAYGTENPRPEQPYAFTQPNAGRVRQSAMMIGYLGRLEGVGSINIGLQKARYRGSYRDGLSGRTSLSRANPWLYNAVATLDLDRSFSLYAGAETGLEDSGAAPENAANRNEQLPATNARQIEAGLRWRFPGGQLVMNTFQVTKPYFSFDVGGPDPAVFTQLGQVRHRGLETSLSGRFGSRFNVVAGALLMQPRVSGGVSGGGRPIGTPSIYSRVDANYRTDIFEGLTPTATVVYTGKRAVRSDLMVPGYASVDLGLRQQFRIGKVPASFRALLLNVFDAKTWKVVAANTLYPEERRRMTIALAMDF